MTDPLYSIRMHASRDGHHLSGAERLAGDGDLESLALALVRRALDHPRGRAEHIHLTVEAVAPEELLRGRLPELRTLLVGDFVQGRRAALHVLGEAAVAPGAATAAMEALAGGAAPGGRSMRGAMLVDAATGERLEADRARGVRVSRMDLAAGAEKELRGGLARLGLDNPHVREALVLAAKVLAAPGIVAELCWSDDPGYTAGYVAAPALGYVRFPHLKPAGEERGGRAFFFRREAFDLTRIGEFLERTPFLAVEVGRLHAATEWRQ
jgi:6-carboxyhexanoate--CoA ligase